MSEAIHISLNTTDLQSSVEFYRRFLGSGPAKQREGYAKFQLADPPLNLALNEVAGAVRPGVSHLGIQVAESSSVWQRRKEVEASGLSTRTEEDVDCCYAVQDKFWVTDPDGTEWEVFTVKDEAGVNRGSNSSREAGACCAPDCCV